MFKIGICEDDKDFALKLKDTIYNKFEKYNLKCNIQCFYSGESILDNITNTKENYDIIFFDIELPNLNGIEVAKRIRALDDNIIFIFITYLNEKVYEVLNLNIFNFIRKSHLNEEIDVILEALIKRLDYLTQKYPFPIDDNTIYFKLYDILYLEVLNRQLIIHTQESSYTSNFRSLKDIPFKLVENQFYEVYRGVVVNLNHIEDFIDNKIVLSDKSIVYISKRKLNSFKQEFFKYISFKREGWQ